MEIDQYSIAPLSSAFDAPNAASGSSAPMVIGVFRGEGIGPEVVRAALDVLDTLAAASNRSLKICFGGTIGRSSLRESGKSLSDESVAFTESVFAQGGALFCGAGGARFVYELRAKFDLFCKFTPLVPIPELADAALVRQESLRDVNIVAVRENAGGLYFGRDRVIDDDCRGRRIETTFGYADREVARILGVADRLARQRRGRVCMVVKRDGVAAISDQWIRQMEELRVGSAIEWEVLDIDNAAYQLVADPRRFDVLVSPNMFGDVLADCGATLLASRGMSYSGNFSGDGHGVFQTGHGAAYDIEGTDTANPLGQILSLAMMLEDAFDWPEGARLVRAAVSLTLGRGIRTADIQGNAYRVVGCRAMAAAVCSRIEALVERTK